MNGIKITHIFVIGGIVLLVFFGVRVIVVGNDKSTQEETRGRDLVQPTKNNVTGELQAQEVQEEKKEETQEEDVNVSEGSDVETMTDEGTGVKKFVMTARQWAFEPSEIRVKKGDHVELTITSEDVLHSFYVVMGDEEINGFLEPGETTVVEFDVNTSGSFVFACLVQCGAGHPNMRGTLIVEE